MKETKTSDQVAAMHFSIKLGQHLATNLADELTNLVTDENTIAEIIDALNLSEQYPDTSTLTLAHAVRYACAGYGGTIDSSDSPSYPGVVPENIIQKRNHASRRASGEQNLPSWTEERLQEYFDRMRLDGHPPILLDEYIALSQLLIDPDFRRKTNSQHGHPDIEMITLELNRICHGRMKIRDYRSVKNIIRLIRSDIGDDLDVPDDLRMLEYLK